VVKTRQKLGLDQRQADEIFDDGVNAFSRYETAKVRTQAQLCSCLRCLTSILSCLRKSGKGDIGSEARRSI